MENTIGRFGHLVAAFVLESVLFAVVCGPSKAATQVTGAGSTFAYPIYSKWFEAYHKLHPDMQISYQAIGSGLGIRYVILGKVDFGATTVR